MKKPPNLIIKVNPQEDENFMNYLPSTKVANLAGVSHSVAMPAIVKSSNLLKKPLIPRHSTALGGNNKIIGYSVSPEVALMVSLQYNNAMRLQLINHIADTQPDYYKSMLNNVITRPHDPRAWHERITFAEPTLNATADTYVRISDVANQLRMKSMQVYPLLVEAGLLRLATKANKQELKAKDYRITLLGRHYILEYRKAGDSYFVYDKLPIISILRAIHASRV